MPVLRTWAPTDRLLGTVAPLALGAAAGTALVVDLDPHGAGFPGDATLSRLVEEGPRRADLAPERRGVAVLANGGVEPDDAREVLEALAAGWPRMVLRLPGDGEPQGSGVVPVLPLTPVDLWGEVGPAVYQRGPWAPTGDIDGVVLPRPGVVSIRALLEGRRPPRSRWLRAWERVWSLPWG